MKVQLYGTGGIRTLIINSRPAPAKSAQPITLTKGGLHSLLNQMPHRWYNAGEIVIELQHYHGIRTNHAIVTEILNQCDVETRTVGKWTEYRRSDKKASEVHRRSCFVCMRELKPYLEKRDVTTDELWDSLKREYNVSSRAALDTPQWASISATLQAATRDLHLVNILVQRVTRERKHR